MSKKFRAYIDESGSAGGKADGNRYFALCAVVIHESTDQIMGSFLDDLRHKVGRRRGDELHFKNLKIKKGHRYAAANHLNHRSFIMSAVASDKSAHPDGGGWVHDDTYYWTITLLLERLSWMATDWGGEMSVTVAHKRHMTAEKLAWHEERLRAGRGVTNGHGIKWDRIPDRLQFSTPKETQSLQAADIFASSVGAALNGEGQRPVINTDYVHLLASRLYRRGQGKVPSYGLKIHPSSSAPSWVAGL